MDYAGAVSALDSVSEGSLPWGDDPLMSLAYLQKRRDTLKADDLQAQVRDMAARLHSDCEEKHFQATRMKALQIMPRAEVVVLLR